MSSIVLTRLTQNGRKMKWCGAEAGGGVCADVQCGNLHFDRGMEVIGKQEIRPPQIPRVSDL